MILSTTERVRVILSTRERVRVQTAVVQTTPRVMHPTMKRSRRDISKATYSFFVFPPPPPSFVGHGLGNSSQRVLSSACCIPLPTATKEQGREGPRRCTGLYPDGTGWKPATLPCSQLWRSRRKRSCLSRSNVQAQNVSVCSCQSR